MKFRNLALAVACTLAFCTTAARLQAQTTQPIGKLADKPLFRDPVFDGAADPSLIYNRAEDKWFMFYTNRRAKAPVEETRGVTWVHGTDIGIAESSDRGATWQYRGVAKINYGEPANYTYWAPEVFEHNGLYHMMLTYVPGVFQDWNHPRHIVHLTSKDLLTWDPVGGPLQLASDRVIDACVYQLADGTWRMWYNNERAGKSTFYADSKDMVTWIDRGKALADDRGEGPKVFAWKGQYWMVIDAWRGLSVYRSDDLTKWTRQPNYILAEPGKGPEDGALGQHPDVQVSGDRAWVFYFVHPGRGPEGATSRPSEYDQRRTLIQVVELKYDAEKNEIRADRDQPTYVNLAPPSTRPPQ